MKVTGENPPIQLSVYQRQMNDAQSQTNRKSGSAVAGIADDKVQLSVQARKVRKAAHALAKMPDVREKKVRQVKMAVEAGTYHIIGAKIAVNLLKEAFENNVLLSQVDAHA